MRFETMSLHHIDAVVPALWERGIREAMIFGIDDLYSLHQYALDHMADRRAYAAVSDDGAFAVFGAFPVDADMHRTWFMATEGFNDHFRPLTRGMKKLIERSAAEDGYSVLETYSACIHPMAAKWFSLLGLQPDGDYNQVNSRIKRFYRRFEPCV